MKTKSGLKIVGAYAYKEKLTKLCAEIFMDEKYKDSSSSGFVEWDLGLKDDSWNQLEVVAMLEEKIVGFMRANYCRPTACVSNLYILNFTDNAEEFAACMALMFKKLIKENASVNWTCIVGSSTEKIYDKICKEFGGNIVGIQKGTAINLSKEIRDLKMYQVPGKKKIK